MLTFLYFRISIDVLSRFSPTDKRSSEVKRWEPLPFRCPPHAFVRPDSFVLLTCQILKIAYFSTGDVMLQIPATGAKPVLITDRPLAMLAIDIAAVRAIAQAAVSVELFTIPLYMCTMYSIQGTHQINSKGVEYYEGREWPGMATSAEPRSANEKAFNIIFSVFIQEMLHLQMAANLATAIGVAPSFTGTELQTPGHGWKCYGPQLSTIPHIVDLQDTRDFKDVRVNLEALNPNQCELFLAIEQPEEQAREQLRGLDLDEQKYFPSVPLAGWSAGKTAEDLPLFGTIGYMYECYARYINIEYTDGQTLWEKLFVPGAVQQDMFNSSVAGHPAPEFPHFDTSFGIDDQDGASAGTFDKAIDMMAAITDQGEGNAAGIKRYRRTQLLKAVQPDYREDDDALKADYPSYAGNGCPVHSRDAAARFDSAAADHYERFATIKRLLGEVRTWQQWHDDGKLWSAAMLVNRAYQPTAAPANIPKPEQVAGALNRLKKDGEASYQTLSTVATGAIYGIVSVLDAYWQDQGTAFPYPSMVGAGDRMSICWAVLGRAADLARDLPPPEPERLQHACQAMDLGADESAATCAALAIYHSCKGSNDCRAQGGCGFVQSDSGGGLCGAPSPGTADKFSAPSDNKCRSFGGCAVPISASQLYPAAGTMKLYNFGPAPAHHALPLPDTLSFELGESVYDKAWQAYTAVMTARGQQAGAAPAPTDLRLALPPST
jgi:hypothetical protein